MCPDFHFWEMLSAGRCWFSKQERNKRVMSMLGSHQPQFPRWHFPFCKGMTHFFNQFRLNCPYPHLGMIYTINDITGFGEIILDRMGLQTQPPCCAPTACSVLGQRSENINWIIMFVLEAKTTVGGWTEWSRTLLREPDIFKILMLTSVPDPRTSLEAIQCFLPWEQLEPFFRSW